MAVQRVAVQAEAAAEYLQIRGGWSVRIAEAVDLRPELRPLDGDLIGVQINGRIAFHRVLFPQILKCVEAAIGTA
jgi:hypothetical protein